MRRRGYFTTHFLKLTFFSLLYHFNAYVNILKYLELSDSDSDFRLKMNDFKLKMTNLSRKSAFVSRNR